MQNGMVDYFKKTVMPRPGQFVVRRLEWLLSQFETGGQGVPVEHPNRIERELVKIFASEFEEFFQNVMRHSNDMTTAGGSLENVKHLTNARPEEFSVRQSPHDL